MYLELSPTITHSCLQGIFSIKRKTKKTAIFKKIKIALGKLLFAKSTGKHLCHSLFFNKTESLKPGTLLRKRLWLKCFHLNFAKF